MISQTAAFAPAKVNLFLHVGPANPDGYHPLVSLMVFADVGDRIAMDPGGGSGLSVRGEFAAGLAGEDPQRNLVWRAVQALLARAGATRRPVKLILDKALPVAAGLGGGSSDAGAALKLVRDAFGLPVDDAALEAIAGELGADGPACLWGRPVIGEGRGDRLAPAPAMPVLPAVLVNPRTPCSTGQVYRTFDEMFAPGLAGDDRPELPATFDSVAAAIRVLAACRNDLERPALQVAPVIGAVLSRLSAQPETRLARLSGSGATCFALCETAADAHALADRLARLEPQWWVRPCGLGGPWDTPAGFTSL